MKLPICFVAVSAVLLFGCSKPTAQETFTMAQHAHAQAQRQADTLKNQQLVSGLFKPVFEEYEKVIAEHPTTQEAETSMFLVATIRNNELHEYQSAVNAYRRYVEHYPDGKQASLAMFMIGYLWNNELRQLDSAAIAYKRFLEKYPNSEMAASARFELENLGKSPDELVPKDVTAEKPKASKKAPKKSR